jgi:hypothetical protein
VIGDEGGGADEVDEQHGGVTRLASEREPAPECRAGDLLADVATEQVAHAVAFPEPGDHPVEARLQQSNFAAVVDGHDHVRLSCLNLCHRSAHSAQRMDD